MTSKRIISVIIGLLFSIYSLQAQMSPEISRIMKKMQSGTELTETEEKTLESWGQEMEKKYGDETKNRPSKNAVALPVKKTGAAAKLPSSLPALTRESYVKLASSAMQSFGPESGDLPGLDQLLFSTEKTTRGADYGALFMMKGAASASVYACAWSASRNPVDILTANNLAVALKQAGDYCKALQVLNYANTIKPRIGLILSNTGWVYYEAGEYEKAKAAFNNALSASPDMVSPCLGLGLIAQREGNNLKARECLRKALKDRYSLAGAKAYQNARQSAGTDSHSDDSPISDEKEHAGQMNVPQIPVYEQAQKMAPQEQVLQSFVVRVQSQLDRVVKKMEATSALIRAQQERAMQNPDNSLVYRRDFAREIMMLEDIDLLLWGEPGNYGRALRESSKAIDNMQKLLDQNSAVMGSLLEKILQLDEKLAPLYEEALACNGEESCVKRVEKKMQPLQQEKEQVNYRLCKLGKQQMDMVLAGNYKALSLLQAQLKEAIPDYYAFTNPILEKIYAPALNEFYNLRREAKVLSEEIAVASRALALAEDAGKYYELECIEPEPPASPDGAIEEANIPAKKPGKCPLGDGVKGGFGAFSFELTCTFVKVAGGEGVLASVKRDFVKHETTIWAGVGVKGEYGNGNVVGEATVGAEVTIGQDAVKDVGFTSSVKAGIGGLVETEISGRIAMDSGATIDMNTDFLP